LNRKAALIASHAEEAPHPLANPFPDVKGVTPILSFFFQLNTGVTLARIIVKDILSLYLSDNNVVKSAGFANTGLSWHTITIKNRNC